jgi:hypothetical protein
MSKTEVMRRLRLGDLQKVLRNHYGHTLPDDDAGREDLFELLLIASLGPEGERKMVNTIEVNAPWVGADEAGQLIDQINRIPAYQRKRTARELGERLRVTNHEREILKLKTIKPFDMTDKQLKDQRRAKERARKKRQRLAKGGKPREKALARQKPWKAEGVHRATWFRRRKGGATNSSSKQKSHATNSSAIKLTNYRGRNSRTEQGEGPKQELASNSREKRKERLHEA